MNIMCRNSVESWSSKSHFQIYWLPHPQLNGVYYHRHTHQQIEKHALRLTPQQFELQNSLISGRFHNQYPFICSLYHYHQADPPLYPNASYHKHYRQVYVYTDRMIPLSVQDWTQQNIIKGLLGLKRLVMTYGPFKITAGNFRKNQQNQVKVWISELPFKNRPDYPLINEQQTVNSLISILTPYNQELKGKLSGSKSLREAIQKLQTSNNTFKKHRHKHTPSIAMNLTSPNQTPFPEPITLQGQINNNRLSKQNAWSRAKSNSQDYFHSPQWKNKNQSVYNSRQKIFAPQMRHPNRSNSLFSNHYAQPFGLNSTNLNPGQGTPIQFVSPQVSFSKLPTTPQSRYTTTSNFNPAPPNFSSRGTNNQWRSNQFQQRSRSKNSYDITIINNNVSNYIGHFPKNSFSGQKSQNAGSLKAGKGSQFTAKGNPYRVPSRYETNPLGKPKAKKGIPTFITDRMKHLGSHMQTRSHPVSNQTTQLFISKYPQTTKNSEKNEFHQRKQAKMFTFNMLEQETQNATNKYLKTKDSDSKVFGQGQETTFGPTFKVLANYFPSNKTKKVIKEEKEQQIDDDRENKMESSVDQRVTFVTKESQKEQVTVNKAIGTNWTDSVELKKQLKKQFNLLIGTDKDLVDQKTHSEKERNGSEEKKQKLNESVLKDRIKQKQQAFAQLKKEALKVLTDD